MFTHYYKTKQSIGESCDKQNFRTRNEMICYHCGKPIPADTNAVLLKMTLRKPNAIREFAEIRHLHIACARKTCK